MLRLFEARELSGVRRRRGACLPIRNLSNCLEQLDRFRTGRRFRRGGTTTDG
jgi:hypothetical protein